METQARGRLGAAVQSALCLLACVALAWANVDAAAAVVGPIASSCVGDCGQDSNVTVDELVTMVNIARAPETFPVALCEPGDANIDHNIDADEILTAMNNALNPVAACGLTVSTPTPSPTPRGMTTPLTGNLAIKGAGRVPIVTMESTIEIVDFGYASAVSSLSARRNAQRYQLAAPQRVAIVPPIETEQAALVSGTVDTSCDGASVSCTVAGDTSTLTVFYTRCTSVTPFGNTVVRDGSITQTVRNPSFCDTRIIPTTAPVTLTLNNFTLVETASGFQVVNISAPAVTDSFVPSGSTCTAPDGTILVGGTETITGTQSIACQETAFDIAGSIVCPPGGMNKTLIGNGLVLTRTVTNSPCRLQVTLDGGLITDNHRLNEHYGQTLKDFTLTEAKAADGSSMVTENGRMNVDCLGDLQFVDTAPVAFDGINTCPAKGRLNAHLCAAAPAVYGPDNQSFQVQMRAENGQTYQLLGGGGCMLPNYDTQITSVVGALGNTFAFASVLQGSCPSVAAGAVAVAAPQCGGTLIPPTSTVKFGPSTDRVGFFPVGDGLLCIGNEGLTLADGAPIEQATASLPAASVATSVGFGLCVGSTFGFGSATPTTQACLMGPPPADGFRLTPGTSVVFAYNTSPDDTVAVGAAGFCIDPSDNTVQTSTVEVIGVPAPPVPSISFTPGGGTAFDFDGDGNIDESVARCTDASLILCH